MLIGSPEHHKVVRNLGMAIYLFLSNRVIIRFSSKFLSFTRYCEGGELFYYIIKKKNLTEKEAAMIMRQSFSALKYLHANKIAHRYLNKILLLNHEIT